MKRTCDKCGVTYNDFDHTTTCPHAGFGFSDSALKHLVDQGIVCKRCEKHVDECECPKEQPRGDRNHGCTARDVPLAPGDIPAVRRDTRTGGPAGVYLARKQLR